MNESASPASRSSLWSALSAAIAFLACNGAFVLVALAAAAGVTLTVNPHVQAAIISLFCVVTVVFVFLGFRVHRSIVPLLLAALGAAVVIGTMYIHFDKLVETAGLALLIIGVVWGWRAQKSA